MKIGQRINTVDGMGEIIKKEFYGSKDDYRVGVKHDIFPIGFHKIYTDDIMYYFKKEITPII